MVIVYGCENDWNQQRLKISQIAGDYNRHVGALEATGCRHGASARTTSPRRQPLSMILLENTKHQQKTYFWLANVWYTEAKSHSNCVLQNESFTQLINETSFVCKWNVRIEEEELTHIFSKHMMSKDNNWTSYIPSTKLIKNAGKNMIISQ